jgi:hypothetical protein
VGWGGGRRSELFYLVGRFVREPACLRVLAHARLRVRVQARASARALVQNTSPKKKRPPCLLYETNGTGGQRPGGGAERGGRVGLLIMSVFVLLNFFPMTLAILPGTHTTKTSQRRPKCRHRPGNSASCYATKALSVDSCRASPSTSSQRTASAANHSQSARARTAGSRDR